MNTTFIFFNIIFAIIGIASVGFGIFVSGPWPSIRYVQNGGAILAFSCISLFWLSDMGRNIQHAFAYEAISQMCAVIMLIITVVAFYQDLVKPFILNKREEK